MISSQDKQKPTCVKEEVRTVEDEHNVVHSQEVTAEYVPRSLCASDNVNDYWHNTYIPWFDCALGSSEARAARRFKSGLGQPLSSRVSLAEPAFLSSTILMSRLGKGSALAHISDATLGGFALFPPSDILNHLTRFLSTWSGTELRMAFLFSWFSLTSICNA